MERRSFVKKSMAGCILANVPFSFVFAGNHAKPLGIGMTDWNLGQPADPTYIPMAEEVGLEAIQVSVGNSWDNIPLREKTVRKEYLELGKKHGIVFCSVAAGGILNQIPLATEPQSAIFVVDALEAANALGSSNILTAFFGNGDLLETDEDGNHINTSTGKYPEYKWKEQDVERVIAVLKQIVPRAEDLGVIIGLENWLTARQNLKIIEEIGSPMVQVYYDIANSWGKGYDVPGEIREIGNHRICEVHIKNKGSKLFYDDEGIVDMEACAKAFHDIGYDKWFVFEGSARPKSFKEDTRANIEFVRRVFF